MVLSSLNRMYFGIQSQLEGAWIRLSVTGELDLASVPEFRRELRRALVESPSIVIDLSGATLLDSVGLGMLLGAARRAGEAGGQVVLVAPSQRVRDILSTTRADEILDIRESFDPAHEDGAGGV